MQAKNDTMTSENEEPQTAVGEPPDGSPDSSEQTVTDESPSLDLIFGILKNGRRRRVIKYLRDAEGEVTLSDLAEHIAAIENDTTPAQRTSSQRKCVYVGLYQCHLPKMDDAGVIEYNQARGLVRRTDQAQYFEQYLDRSASTADRQWYKYYGATAAVGLIPFVLALGLSVPAFYVSVSVAAVLVAISICSVYHWRVATAEKDTGR